MVLRTQQTGDRENECAADGERHGARREHVPEVQHAAEVPGVELGGGGRHPAWAAGRAAISTPALYYDFTTLRIL